MRRGNRRGKKQIKNANLRSFHLHVQDVDFDGDGDDDDDFRLSRSKTGCKNNSEAKDSENIRYRKLESGVKIQDIIEGEGPEAHEGDLVEFNYVCRRSNGYFVHSTVDQFSGESSPVVLPLDGKQIIEGLKDVIVGMKAGGKRRALIPPNVGYINENLKPIPDEFGPRRSLLSHASEPLVFEVQLLKVL